MTAEGCTLCTRDESLILAGDTDAVAVLDLKPLAPAHTIVVSTEHYTSWESVPDRVREGMRRLCDDVGARLVSTLQAEGTTVVHNDGVAADVGHVHMHVIPRWSKDGLGMWPAAEAPPEELKAIRDKLRRYFDGPSNRSDRRGARVAAGASLRAGRWLLRPWSADDADAVHAACQDAEIQRWTTVPVPYGHHDAVWFVTEFVEALTAAKTGIAFAITDEQSGDLAGSISLEQLKTTDASATLGYWIVSKYRRRGVAAAAIGVVTSWAFCELDLVRIEVPIASANYASRSLVESCGFTLEGVHRKAICLRGTHNDLAIYSQIRDSRARTAPALDGPGA